MANTLTASRLRELLHYDPLTGAFRWRLNKSSRARQGCLAGSLRSDGYQRISVDGINHQAHRLAWLYVRGAWPTGLLDHVNGVRSDNRFSNLRIATPELNARNQRRAHSSNATSGLLGVSLDRVSGRWRAQLWTGKKNKNLGLFDKKEDAHSAYLKAKKEHHGIDHKDRNQA